MTKFKTQYANSRKTVAADPVLLPHKIEVGAVQSTVKLAQGIATPLVRSTIRIQAPMTVKGCGSKDACVRHLNVIRTDMSNIADMTEEQYTIYGQLLQKYPYCFLNSLASKFHIRLAACCISGYSQPLGKYNKLSSPQKAPFINF